MKGILLAGGEGTRLAPCTRAICKQLLPVYNKPMIYYPLTMLVKAGIDQILLITHPRETARFRDLLSDGWSYGIEIRYAQQEKPRGIAEALCIAEEFLDGDSSCLLLGDNLFAGEHFEQQFKKALKSHRHGAHLFGCEVPDPQRFGVAECDTEGRILSIEEKPLHPKSKMAVTGLYLYDARAPSFARQLRPSKRGELEITDLNRLYAERGEALLWKCDPSTRWYDTGTFESLLEASCYVEERERGGDHFVGALELEAFRRQLIDTSQLKLLASELGPSSYRDYLYRLTREANCAC